MAGFEKLRSQFLDRLNGLFVKRNDAGGQFMDVKTTGGKFKSVRVEKRRKAKKVVQKSSKKTTKKKHR
jgi:hypothetical protein